MSIGVTVGAGLAIAGGIGAAGSLASGLIGASASKTAANEQVTQQDKALQFQEQQYNTQQANLAPYIAAGQQSVGQLATGLANGTYGPGSIPAFAAPSLSTAANYPGFQFQEQQGDLGIERGAAAGGGAFTGGTLKALSGYNQGLAGNAYQNVFNNSLQSYQAALAGQSQSYNQLAQVAGLGQSANNTSVQSGLGTGAQVGSTLTNIGSAQAAGTIGQANALNSGIGGLSSAASLPLYLQYLQQQQAPQQFSPGANPLPGQAPPTPAPYQPPVVDPNLISAGGGPA